MARPPALLLAVYDSPVTNFNDLYEQQIILDRIKNAIITNTKAVRVFGSS